MGLNSTSLIASVSECGDLPMSLVARTRRVYDCVSGIYPLSSYLFHSKAHRCALETAGIRDGMRVLEVATGSGEMFRRLVRINRHGSTVGLDLSPNMAARTQRRIRREFPEARTLCHAVDARRMAFGDETFGAIVCCYLFELLPSDAIVLTIDECRRVLEPNGTLTLTLIGQNTAGFNRAYRVCNRLAPAFWGRQVEHGVPDLIEAANFQITHDRMIRQGFYPSRVLTARK